MNVINSLSDHFRNTFLHSQQKVIVESPFCSQLSLIKGIVQDIFIELKKILRIDLTIRDVCVHPSPENIRSFIFSASVLIGTGASFILFPTLQAVSIIVFSTLCLIVISKLGTKLLNDYYAYQRSVELKNWKLSRFFPLNSALKHIFFGVISVPVAMLTSRFIQLSIDKIIDSLGLATREQYQATLMNHNRFSAIVFGLDAILRAPIFEEILFRGFIQEKLFSLSKNDSDNKILALWEKTKPILITSFLFGLLHYIPQQEWSNITICMSTFSLGIFFSLLKEMTGDLWAPTTLHALNNTLSVLQLWKVI